MQFFLKYILFILLFFYSLSSFSQQVSLNTQFYYFDYVLNPALAGENKFNPVYLSYRNQWSGFNGSPETFHFGGSFSLNSKNALGFQFLQDFHGGAFRQSGLHFNYAKKTHFNNNSSLSFGVGAFLDQFSGDFSNLELINSNDNLLSGQQSKLTADLDIGLNLNLNKLNIGISASNILQSRIDDNLGNIYFNNLRRQFLLISSYSIQLDNNFILQPKFLLRSLESGIFHSDLVLLAKHKSKYIFGLSHRINTAFSFIAGIELNGAVFSYSYDLATSNINRFTGSTHEIVVGFKFNKREQKFSDKFSYQTVKNIGITELKVDSNFHRELRIDKVSNDSIVTNFSESQPVDSVVEELFEEKEKNFVFENIEFEFDKSTITNSFENELLQIAELMNNNSNWKLRIEGHTDAKRDTLLAKVMLKRKGIKYSIEEHNTLSKNYNMILSIRRAKSVSNFLIKSGVSKSRIEAKGYGEEKPIASNKTELGRKKNRRVELIIIK